MGAEWQAFLQALTVVAVVAAAVLLAVLQLSSRRWRGARLKEAAVAVGDVAGQARQVMTNLAAAREAAGAGFDDVLKTTVYVVTTDRSDLLAAWQVVREAFGEHDAPSTLVGLVPGSAVSIGSLASSLTASR